MQTVQKHLFPNSVIYFTCNLPLTEDFALVGFSWWKSPDEAFLGGGRLFLPGPRGSADQFYSLQGADVC